MASISSACSSYGASPVGCVSGAGTIRANDRHDLAARLHAAITGLHEPLVETSPGAADTDDRDGRDQRASRRRRIGMSQELPDFLASIELFSDLDQQALDGLEGKLDRVRLPGGRALFRLGDAADCMYIVLAGRLQATVEVDDETKTIGELGRGDALGEMALIGGGRRSATVRALRDSELLRLSKSTFEQLIEESPSLLLAASRRVVGHYQQVLNAPRAEWAARISTVALVPLTDEIDLETFASQFAVVLGSAGTRIISSATVDRELGPGMAQIPLDHANNGQLVSYLNDLETDEQLIVYLGEPRPSTWTSRCARQADRVLLIARPGDDPRPGSIERRLAADGLDHAPIDLVLLHPEASELYSGTRTWLAERRLEHHHHVAIGSTAGLARMARRLTGKATGLVLGGGGARAFSQIGVLRALEECELPVDMVGGTSMGAFIGAQLASGWSSQRIHEYNRECWAGGRPLKDYTLPYLSLVSGDNFLRVAKDLYGEHGEIEDLPLSFFCCTSNLTRATVRACRTGSLYRWLCATIAVPGVAPPVPTDGDLYVDGAVLDNLPTDVMDEVCDGQIVAVDVTPVVELSVDRDMREPPSGWSLALTRFNPLKPSPGMPSIFELLGRVTALASIRQLAEMKELANLYLHPPTEGFSMFDFDRIDELAQLGYDYALPRIERYLASR